MNFVETKSSFLTSGPVFRLDLPESLVATLPSMSSPLDNGIGGRSFTFLPFVRDVDDPAAGNTFIDTYEAADGREVVFYKRNDDPPLWWLIWQLEKGRLYTHLREEDGSGMATRTAAAVEVIEDDENSTPFVLIDEPLTFAASAAPGYQERLQFRVDAGSSAGASLVRPGFMANGQIATSRSDSDGDGLAKARAGLGMGIELIAWSESMDEAVEVAERAMASLRTA